MKLQLEGSRRLWQSVRRHRLLVRELDSGKIPPGEIMERGDLARRIPAKYGSDEVLEALALALAAIRFERDQRAYHAKLWTCLWAARHFSGLPEPERKVWLRERLFGTKEYKDMEKVRKNSCAYKKQQARAAKERRAGWTLAKRAEASRRGAERVRASRARKKAAKLAELAQEVVAA
jgi:hypothetical protein